MKCKIITLMALLAMLSGVLHAGRLDDSYAKMLAVYGKLTSWQATLNQTNYFKASNYSLKSSGSCYYQGRKVAIRYNKPNEQFLWIKDGKVTIYDKTARTAAEMTLQSTVQSLNPAEIVKTYWAGSTKSLLQSAAGTTTILLKPKSVDQVREIRVTISNATGYISKLVYSGPEGNTVSISFSRIRVNQKIPTYIWTVNIPKAVTLNRM